MARGRRSRLDAAVIVLRSSNEPMTPTQIAQVGALNGLFERGDRSVAASVNTALYNKARQPHSTVVSLGDGRYGLQEWGKCSYARTRAPASPCGAVYGGKRQ